MPNGKPFGFPDGAGGIGRNAGQDVPLLVPPTNQFLPRGPVNPAPVAGQFIKTPRPLMPTDRGSNCVDWCDPALSLPPVMVNPTSLPSRDAQNNLKWVLFHVDRPSIIHFRSAPVGTVYFYAPPSNSPSRPASGQNESEAVQRSALDIVLPHAGDWLLAYEAVNGTAPLSVAVYDALGLGETSSFRRYGITAVTQAQVNVGAGSTAILAANPARRWAVITNIQQGSSSTIADFSIALGFGAAAAATGMRLYCGAMVAAGPPMVFGRTEIRIGEGGDVPLFLGAINGIRLGAVDVVVSAFEGT